MSSYHIESEIRYGELLSLFSKSFREIAFEIDADPNAIMNYKNLPAIDFILSDRSSTTLDRTKYLEAFSYGDPGVVLACPGPSLSGLMLRELGLPAQIDSFYTTLKEKRMRTFFALTEPNKGSDANHIETRLIKKNKADSHYFLNGVKSFFGNGAVADMGIVLAKVTDGPLGIRAAWITPEIIESCLIEKETLPMFSLRGAQIALMKFNDTKIPESQILGNHLSACQNGLLGITKVFNKLRTGVGALAVGQAQATYDMTFNINRKKIPTLKSTFSDLNLLLSSSRQMLHEAAIKVDINSLDGQPVSLAKANATKTAEIVIEQCIDLCGLDDLLENPWLLKAYRDVFCWEYMEGSTDIQKKHISRDLPKMIKELL